eukprot:scaffold241079_cov27-Tisochrysis_lutea.AAC.1
MQPGTGRSSHPAVQVPTSPGCTWWVVLKMAQTNAPVLRLIFRLQVLHRHVQFECIQQQHSHAHTHTGTGMHALTHTSLKQSHALITQACMRAQAQLKCPH